MDFTQKRIGNGDTGYIFGLLDMHNDSFIALTGHPEKNGDIVAKNLEILKQIQSQKQKIEIRSDCGKEFYNEAVSKFCNKNNTVFRFVPLWKKIVIGIYSKFINRILVSSDKSCEGVLLKQNQP